MIAGCEGSSRVHCYLSGCGERDITWSADDIMTRVHIIKHQFFLEMSQKIGEMGPKFPIKGEK